LGQVADELSKGCGKSSEHGGSCHDLMAFGKVGTIGYIYHFNLVISRNVLFTDFLEALQAKSERSV
jgi:hypothetical protein